MGFLLRAGTFAPTAARLPPPLRSTLRPLRGRWGRGFATAAGDGVRLPGLAAVAGISAVICGSSTDHENRPPSRATRLPPKVVIHGQIVDPQMSSMALLLEVEQMYLPVR